MTSQRLTLTYAHCTDNGRARTHNEDCIVVDAALGLALVADGMGGYNAGEIASSMAAELISASITVNAAHGSAALDHETERQHLLHKAIHIANERILAAAQSTAACNGMGTTLVLALFSKDQVTIAHIGDSRAYRLREGKLEQLTQDHTLLQQQLQAGLLTNEQASKANNRHWLTRALGVMPQVAADMREEKLQTGDRYLLCSDGLSDHVPLLKLQDILSHSGTTQAEQCRLLIAAANQHGGDDNISVVLISVRENRSVWQVWQAWLGKAKLQITKIQKGAKLPPAKH